MQISNPSFNYDKNGKKYSNYRQTDPRIYEYIKDAPGSVKIVVNVGRVAVLMSLLIDMS